MPLSQDAYVVPNSIINYGTAATINVGGPASAQALVQFDLSTLPAGIPAASVAKATLALFVSRVGAPGTVNISVANGAWAEAGVNGTNAPVPAAAVASGVAIPGAGGYLYVDATAAVQSWLSGTTNSGFIVTPPEAAQTSRSTAKKARPPATLRPSRSFWPTQDHRAPRGRRAQRVRSQPSPARRGLQGQPARPARREALPPSR